MKIEKVKKVTVEQRTIDSVECDVCRKKIHGKYWELLTGHNDWGNDSRDSMEYFDLCSEKCVHVKLQEYFKDCTTRTTQYFEMEQQVFEEKTDEP